jgi:hypothetical protein
MSLEEDLKKQMGYMYPVNTCNMCIHYAEVEMGDSKCHLNGAFPLTINTQGCCKFFKNKKEKK